MEPADNRLIIRLLQERRIKVKFYKHKAFPLLGNGMPSTGSLPVMALYLTLPDEEQTVVGLTDVKRDDGRNEGLSYCFLLPPVWNADKKQWLHPLTHLANEFIVYLRQAGRSQVTEGRFDSLIKNPTTGEIVSFFGANLSARGEWQDDFLKYSVKVPMLQSALMEYCGEYGIPADAVRNGKSIEPTDISLEQSRVMTIIDYMRDSTAEQMWEQAVEADAQVRLCLSGNKQTKRRVRKYVLGHKNGVAIYSNPHNHIARGGKQSAQLARALEASSYKVAILYMDSKTQVYATPSGVEKQQTKRAFMPRTFNTRAEWDRYVQTTNVNEEQIEPKVVEYPAWNSEKRRVWVGDARDTIWLGKLVDRDNNKFMPRYLRDQAITEAGENIDLLMPVTELIAKDNVRALLGSKQVPEHLVQTIKIPFASSLVGPESDKWIEGGRVDENGLQTHTLFQELQAVVIDVVMFRTGSASENIPARHRQGAIRGFDMHTTLSVLQEYGINAKETIQPDLSGPIELQDFAKQIRKQFATH